MNLKWKEKKDFVFFRHLFEDRNREETSVSNTGCEKFASKAASKRFILNNAGSPPEGLRFSLP